jgi:hypothetical protein
MNQIERTIAVFREIGIIQERMDAILKDRLPTDLPPTQYKLLNHHIFTTNNSETASAIAHIRRQSFCHEPSQQASEQIDIGTKSFSRKFKLTDMQKPKILLKK